MVDPSPDQARQVEIRIGISSISLDQARQNLQREIPAWDFDQTRAQARKTWNEALSKIEVKGGTEDQRTIFYTSLYRVLTSLSNMAEDDKYISRGDHQVRSADGHGFNPGNGGTAVWGNYRSLEPVHLLVHPAQQIDMMRSYVILYEQTGRMIGRDLGFGRGLGGPHR